jgi:hypothetical protein
VALLADVDALAGLLALDVEAREIAVVRLLRRVEVDAVRRAVGETVLLDVRDEGNLLGNVIGRAAQHRGILDVERLHVGEERVGVELCDLPRRLACAARALLHLVFAGVGVGDQVTDVGDVHHVPDAVAVPFERAFEQILEQERPVVADVLIVVHGGAARVEPDFAVRLQRLERAQRPREVVVKAQGSGHARGKRDRGNADES